MDYQRLLTVILQLLCTGVAVLQQCDSANILVLEGVPSPSHHLWMRTLTTKLVSHGHNVTSLSCDVDDKGPANLHYLHLEQMYSTLYGDYAQQKDGPTDVFEYAELGTWTKLFISWFWNNGMFRGSISSEGFQRLLDYPTDFKFDLIIYDAITSPALLVFLDKFDSASVISVTPFPLVYTSNHITGSLYFPAFVPNQNLARLESTSFWARLNNFLLTYAEHYYLHHYMADLFQSELAKRVPLKYTIAELYAKTKLLMPNYNPAVNLVQPTMPMIVPVGGLQIAESKPLPGDLEEIFADASKGVVYFSLGSNIKSEQLGSRRLTELIEAFRALPQYTFLWKIDDSGLDLKLPANVYVRKWLPQNDILAHNKTLLFISHGGGLSTQETTWFGVPMLGVPVFLDQHPNVNLAVDSGTAMKFNLRDIDRAKFKEAIEEMINEPRYRQRAKLRSVNFQDQKEHPLERAIWWIDYILRNPDVSFLKQPRLNGMNVFIKHSIDVIAFLTLLTIALFLVLYKIVKWIIRRKSMPSTFQAGDKKVQ